MREVSENLKNTVSIIIPVYNVKNYLKKCVNSVIKQTYKDLDIILVDDGSTDGSSQLCDKFKENDNRIRVIHKNNEGLGLARNTGLLHAKGKYVSFIDSDDYVGTTFIENLVKKIVKFSADACIAGYSKVDDNYKILYSEIYDDCIVSGDIGLKGLLIRMLGNLPSGNDSIKMSVWGNLYSMELIKENKLKFVSERKIISEDIIWNNDFITCAKRVLVDHNDDYFYLSNNNSLSTSYKKDRFQKCLELYLILKHLCSEESLGKEAIMRIQKQFFINVRTCIRQERTKTLKKQFAGIKDIVNNKKLQVVIKEYPIDALPYKQRLFIKLIKSKNSYCLTLLNIGRIV